MGKTTEEKKKTREKNPFPPALHLFSAALILFLVVSVFTGRNITQTEESVSRLLAERANTIMEMFEGNLLGDMRTRSTVRVQGMLEDLASREDILFVALIRDDGVILAHSDPSRVGHLLKIDNKEASPDMLDSLRAKEQDDGQGHVWSVMNMEGKRAFVVHRALFQRSRPNFANNSFPVSGAVVMMPDGARPVQVFVGQNDQPLQSMYTRNMRSSLLAGALVLITGLAGLMALHYFERGMESRRRMQVAERLARDMVEEVKRLEREVRQREKLAAVGDLAAGVAHELRNPLSSIKGYATYFGSRFPEGSEDRESARIMVQEVERLNRVITDLIGVSRPTDIHPVETDPGTLVNDTLRLLAQDAGQRGVILSREGTASSVWLDPDRFRQALLNVCLNAVEAMENGGELHLRLAEEGDWVLLDVCDTGPGIPPELLNRIFDPYFTTKSQGTGLGLVVSLKIVEAHGGSMHISSKVGEGSTVHFVLPRHPVNAEDVVKSTLDASLDAVQDRGAELEGFSRRIASRLTDFLPSRKNKAVESRLAQTSKDRNVDQA